MIENTINPEKELHIYMGSYTMFITPHPEFPIRIVAHELVKTDEPIIYVPEILCTAQIVIHEDNTIGHCVCSNCNASIRYFDKYCAHCGGKIVGTNVQENTSLFVEGDSIES